MSELRQLTPAQALALVRSSTASGEPPPLLLDVREEWEVATAALRIDGAPHRHIPIGQIMQRWEELDPAQPILCICHHGMRSAQVVAFLERQGHAAVYNLAGGIDAWSAQIDPQVPRY